MSEILNQIIQANHEFKNLHQKSKDWIAQSETLRESTYQTNRQWFKEAPICESSVFLYLDLSSSTAAVKYAREVQSVCARILGDRCFNFSPPDRLHATLFTEIVLENGRLPDSTVKEVERKYDALIRNMRRMLIFVLGPWLTPGGVVLGCRTYGTSVLEARKVAAAMSDGASPPRIPTIDYASLGYLTGGTAEQLHVLDQQFERLRSLVEPIPVAVETLMLSLTVNKRLMVPTYVRALNLPPATLSPDEGPLDEAELEMWHVAVQYSNRYLQNNGQSTSPATSLNTPPQ